MVWRNLTTGAYCNNYYDTNSSIYGRLYNWYAVNNSHILAPIGWHIPSDAEWTTLITYLGGENVAGGKLKEKGTSHWESPNSGASNDTGFAGLPGGNRGAGFSGAAEAIGYHGYWWSSTESTPSRFYLSRMLSYDSGDFRYYNGGDYNNQSGLSVRCIKD